MKDKETRYGVPAILTFFLPGLGQIVKGKVLRGILIFLAVAITLPTILPPFCIWIWAIVDAYKG